MLQINPIVKNSWWHKLFQSAVQVEFIGVTIYDWNEILIGKNQSDSTRKVYNLGQQMVLNV